MTTRNDIHRIINGIWDLCCCFCCLADEYDDDFSGGIEIEEVVEDTDDVRRGFRLVLLSLLLVGVELELSSSSYAVVKVPCLGGVTGDDNS